jgi:hypothetical protein
MIINNKEFFSSPYYFYLKEGNNKYSLYFSVEETLTEARKKDEVVHFKKDKEKDVKKYLSKVLKSKEKKTTKKVKNELEELVNADGGMMNARTPMLNQPLYPKKTMDQTVSAARITNDPITRGYRTYFGESENLEETDMSDAFGYEETEDMDGKETYKYFVKELGLEPDDAKKRVKQKGQDPTGKKDKKSKYYKDKNFVTRATLSEIQKQKMIKVLEDILVGKNQKGSEITEKEPKVSPIVKKNLATLKKQAEKEKISLSDLIKLLKSE